MRPSSLFPPPRHKGPRANKYQDGKDDQPDAKADFLWAGHSRCGRENGVGWDGDYGAVCGLVADLDVGRVYGVDGPG
jgi:hypothetical protein